MSPWNDWYHCTASTFGSWLDGDSRGFRTRHHREHVEGDYKNPPPVGKYDARMHASQNRMQSEVVFLSSEQRVIVCQSVAEKLEKLGFEFAEIAVAATHMHLLAKLTQSPGMAIPGLCAANALQDGRDPLPRHVMGLLKKHASFTLRENGQGIPGGIWATRSLAKPIVDADHFTRTAAYIRDHVEESGAVWSLREQWKR